MQNEIDLNAPEFEALRDYLEAVRGFLPEEDLRGGAFEEVQSNICAQVASEAGGPPYTKAEVDAAVRLLDAPESYAQDFSTRPDVRDETPARGKGSSLPLILGIAAIMVFGVVAAIAGASYALVSYHNRIVVAANEVDQAEAQVQVVLQRRFDLIPNLVETVKGYARHESEVLLEVVKLRQQWAEAADPGQKEAISLQLEPHLYRIISLAEDYPDLKANQNFLTLQTQLESTENRVSIERRRVNLALGNYNALLEIFPGNVAARLFDHQPRIQYFKAAEEAQTPPRVSF